MKYRTVKECFIECEFDKLLTEFFYYWRTEEELTFNGKYKEAFRNIIDGIEKLSSKIGENMIGIDYWYPYPDDVPEEWVPLSINSNGIDLKTLNVFVTEPGDETKYHFKCSEWEIILGYRVPDSLIYEYGLETLMAAVLYEMTWFGSSAEEIHNYLLAEEKEMKKYGYIKCT